MLNFLQLQDVLKIFELGLNYHEYLINTDKSKSELLKTSSNIFSSLLSRQKLQEFLKAQRKNPILDILSTI